LVIPFKDRLIVALDVPSVEEANEVVDQLGDTVGFYKIGLGLHYVGGIELARRLKGDGKKVFWDAKIHDIEATTQAAVESVVQLGVDFLTLHGEVSTLRYAVAGRATSNLKLLVVTVLTSLDDAGVAEMGFGAGVVETVLRKTKAALHAGCDGVIASGREIGTIRQMAGSQLLIIVPGIRSAGISADEQKRTATPEQAIAAGADHIVMGRQILRAANRQYEAARVLDRIAAAIE
jgi:orotidine-5'-phosphate decarboxylase